MSYKKYWISRVKLRSKTYIWELTHEVKLIRTMPALQCCTLVFTRCYDNFDGLKRDVDSLKKQNNFKRIKIKKK